MTDKLTLGHLAALKGLLERGNAPAPQEAITPLGRRLEPVQPIPMNRKQRRAARAKR